MRTFNQDIVLIFKIGFLAYLLDILTAKDLYKNCKYPVTNQVELLFHHVLYIFSLTGWLSDNKTLLKIYVVSTILYFTHWYFNNNNCRFTEMTKKDCNINIPLRTIQYINGIIDHDRKGQITIGVITLCIAIYKIYYIN
jgi:hypothetical protein